MSDVTTILTGRINLKRSTSYLLDATAVASSLSPTRQPAQTVRLELELAGCTVSANGRVTVYAPGGSSVAQYVVTDRVTGTKYAIKVSDGVLNITATASAASDEPIVQDSLTSGIYWKIFISDGVIGFETTATVQDDTVILIDTVTSTEYLLIVSDAVLGIGTSPGAATSEVFTFSENGSKVGTVNFASIAGLTMSGITDGFIKMRAKSKMGEPVNQQVLVASSTPVRFYTQNGRIRAKKAGQELDAKYKIMVEPTLDLQNNDLLYVISGCPGLTMAQVDFLEYIYDFDGVTHHIEASLLNV